MSVITKADETLGFLSNVQPLHRRSSRWRTQTLQIARRLAELTVVFLVGVAVATLMPFPSGPIPPLWAILASCAATIAAIESGRPRHAIKPRAAILALQLMAASASGTLVLALAGLSWRIDVAWGAGELIGAAVLLAVFHALYAETVDRLLADGRLATHVAVVGTGPAAKRLRAELERGDPLAVKVVGCYAPVDDEPAYQAGARGSLRTLLSDCRMEFVDAIVLAPEPGDPAAVPSVCRSLRACTQDVYVTVDLGAELDDRATDSVTTLGPAEVVLLSRCPVSGAAAFVKRAFDLAGALGLLAFMAPLLAFVALTIVVDSRGPILFRQLRVGYNNQLFYILKFRSMRVEVTDRLAKQQTVRGDPRITRVGRVIRRLSLDELPQLLNVLRGEMSLVGPRPHAPGTSIGGQRVHTLVDNYARRHLVRPGITGLAQVRGLRGGLQDRRQVADRLAADLDYIERWSIWLDIRILLGTVLLEMRNSRGC